MGLDAKYRTLLLAAHYACHDSVRLCYSLLCCENDRTALVHLDVTRFYLYLTPSFWNKHHCIRTSSFSQHILPLLLFCHYQVTLYNCKTRIGITHWIKRERKKYSTLANNTDDTLQFLSLLVLKRCAHSSVPRSMHRHSKTCSLLRTLEAPLPRDALTATCTLKHF